MGEVNLTVVFTCAYFGITNLWVTFQSDKRFAEPSLSVIWIIYQKWIVVPENNLIHLKGGQWKFWGVRERGRGNSNLKILKRKVWRWTGVFNGMLAGRVCSKYIIVLRYEPFLLDVDWDLNVLTSVSAIVLFFYRSGLSAFSPTPNLEGQVITICLLPILQPTRCLRLQLT